MSVACPLCGRTLSSSDIGPWRRHGKMGWPTPRTRARSRLRTHLKQAHHVYGPREMTELLDRALESIAREESPCPTIPA